MGETPLHAALKAWYCQPNDRTEVPVDDYIVDVVRDDLLVEIQTRSFGAIRAKLAELAKEHTVRLVHPIAREKWIVKLAPDGQEHLSRRKSPKRGRILHLFDELVYAPDLLSHPNLSIEVLMTQEEEVRRHEPGRRWRRKGWVTHERRLLDVVERRLFCAPSDLGDLLPQSVVEPFTTSDLAAALKAPRRLAQKMAYCLRKMGTIVPEGKMGNAILYVRTR
jgi:hypothetical protein